MGATDDAKLAAEILRQMEGIDPDRYTAIELAQTYATVDGLLVARALGLAHVFQEAARKLQDPATPLAERKTIEATVRAHAALQRGQTERQGERTRRLAAILEVLGVAEKNSPTLAEYVFVQLLGSVDEKCLARVNDKTMALMHECASLWKRSPGAPRTRDRRRAKWDVFADLHRGLGLGDYEPDTLKKEVSPSRLKKRRTVRH